VKILIAAENKRMVEAIRAERPHDALEVIDPTQLNKDTAVWEAVRGVDAVVHLGEIVGKIPGHQMDRATRGTYMLLRAAVDAGVRRFVLGSTLSFFRSYPEDVYITEYWRPEPTDDLHQMLPALSEIAAREFAREHAISVSVLRLGRLVDPDTETGVPDIDWLDYRDAAKAFALAVDRDTSHRVNWQQRYAVFHVVGNHPNPRFLLERNRIAGLQPALGLEPRGFGEGAK
jgi:nucleoside-diphosphate-sugar epimerase